MLIPHECRQDPPIWCGQCCWNKEKGGAEGLDYFEQNTVDPRRNPVPTTVELKVCRYRGKEALAKEIVDAKFNPTKRHWRCDHPRLALGLVTECTTCGGTKKAPFCGPSCQGFTVNPVVGDDTDPD